MYTQEELRFLDTVRSHLTDLAIVVGAEGDLASQNDILDMSRSVVDTINIVTKIAVQSIMGSLMPVAIHFVNEMNQVHKEKVATLYGGESEPIRIQISYPHDVLSKSPGHFHDIYMQPGPKGGINIKSTTGDHLEEIPFDAEKIEKLLQTLSVSIWGDLDRKLGAKDLREQYLSKRLPTQPQGT